MELSKFCPRCGREVEELYGNKKKLCANCYPEKNELLEVPEIVEIEVCSVCGRMKDGGEWMEEYTVQDQLSLAFSSFNREEVEMRLQYWEEEDRTMVRVHASRGRMEASYDTEVRFDRTQCGTCSRFSSGFYKVKMQIRGDADLEKISNEVMDQAAEITNRDRNKFVSNVENTDHGVNVFLSTESMAKEILNRLKSRYDPEVKRSYELVGEENGEEVYRNVISVRIVP